MRKRPGWKILVSRGGEENWAERGDSKVVGQGNDRRIFLSFFLLAELFPIPRQYSGKKKRIGWRKVGKEKNRKREREREVWPGFDSESSTRVDRLPEANGSTLRGNGQMVWKLLDCTSSRIEIPLCIFPHVRFPLVSELATNRRMENPASRLVYDSFDPIFDSSRPPNAI